MNPYFDALSTYISLATQIDISHTTLPGYATGPCAPIVQRPCPVRLHLFCVFPVLGASSA